MKENQASKLLVDFKVEQQTEKGLLFSLVFVVSINILKATTK